LQYVDGFANFHGPDIHIGGSMLANRWTVVGRVVLACASVGGCIGLSAAQPSTETPPTEQGGPAGVDLSRANDLVRTGEYAEAENVLAALQEEHPDDARLLLMRGEVLLALGQGEQALPFLRRTVELDPERPRAHFQLATALQGSGDREGVQAYAEEIQLNDDAQVQVMARLNRSLLLEQQQNWSASAAELQAVLQLEPGRLEAYGDVASLFLRAGELDAAAKSLEHGLARGFRSARHHYILGARYYEKKAYEAAIEALLRALAIDPGLAEAERSLAGALDQTDRGAEALEHLRRYLELEPEAPDAERVRDRIREIEAR